MEMLKSVEEKLLYVETLTRLAIANEKITDSSKLVIYNILSNYDLPHEYGERILRNIGQKASIEDILIPIKEKNLDFKLLLIQELVMLNLVSGTYHKEKKKLIEICILLNINVKLENIKEHVLSILKEREMMQKQKTKK